MNMAVHNMDAETQRNISLWLEGLYDDKTKTEVRKLLKECPQEAIDAFYTNLSFGTGGMRGIMGVGSNRMNNYTVRAATQGLANYLNQQPPPPQGHSVFIGYDSRRHAKDFAEEASKVLAANNIQVFLCRDLRPTPLVSFGCRLKKCSAAIMITASHNPPDYNGYKVYWSDGAQILPPHDKGIIKEIAKITDPAMVKTVSSIVHPSITLVGEDIDRSYIEETFKLQLNPEMNQRHGKELKIIYTSLHGTGITLIPSILPAWGFSSLSFVEKQIIPDGNFTTVKSPNPEESAALEMGIKQLQETHDDLLIATDPDADRVGVAINHHDKVVLLSGNQIASLCLAYICETLIQKGKMPKKAAFIKTIGTTELFQAICDAYHQPCFNVLTGFKYIAEKIRQWENNPEGYHFVFGGEESFGYLLGTLTRDKDGIIASALICEVALYAKRQGKTLVDLLHELYAKYGVFSESLLSVEFEESKEGKEKMASGMKKLRSQLPETINDLDVIAVEDYQKSLKRELKTGKTEQLHLPQSDVLLFWLQDQSKLMIRPSGTEPKIKIYCGVRDNEGGPIESAFQRAQLKAHGLLHAMEQLLNSSY